jgi:transcription termination factor Rho
MERRPNRNGYQRSRRRGGGGGNQDGGGNVPRGNTRAAREQRELREQREAAEMQATHEQIGESQTMATLSELEARSVEELHEIAREMDITGYSRLRKSDLAFRILQTQTEQEGNIFRKGILDVMPDGFGFLRLDGYLPGPNDIYVSQSQVRRFGLRMGDEVLGQVRQAKEGEKYFSLLRVEAVNGMEAETAKQRPNFSDLTPIFPRELIDLETNQQTLSTRLLNLVAPIGRGQRGLVVSPPKAGKTLLLKAIANGISANYGNDIHLMVVLIGERPEEVTDMQRSVKGEVIASTFDEPVENHTKVAEMSIERAKRLVEGGQDVAILLDSLTRLARAYNTVIPPSGRTLTGGMDPIALYPPKQFYGAARNIEEGGSLTIIATCLVDTGSRMDDVVYEEFKGTGNMELHLDRKLAERRIFPSIDIQKSGTRREELLLDEPTYKQVVMMRRMVSVLGGTEGTELLLARLAKTKDNPEFLTTLTKDVL